MANTTEEAKSILNQFMKESKLQDLDYKIIERSDGFHMQILVGNPNERFYTIANKISDILDDDSAFKNRVLLKKIKRTSWLQSPEVMLLQNELSASMTIGKSSLRKDFFNRYIKSIIGAESQISSDGNHFVFGRRGSGKSSLLLYALRTREINSKPSIWLAMQTYERRSDTTVILDIISELIEELKNISNNTILNSIAQDIDKIKNNHETVDENTIRKLAPQLSNAVKSIVKIQGDLHIFIDDLHVISPDIQPLLISILYSFSRGNSVYLKMSAIENFTKHWDRTKKIGLDVPNDAQVIRLDYNLTAPSKAKDHIENILKKHAEYCGIPSLNIICRDKVIARLVWVAAGVPRDAINIFLQALSNSLISDHKKISVSSVNKAASNNLNDKLNFISTDATSSADSLVELIERIRAFCQNEHTNAFLTRIDNHDNLFQLILKLIDLRLLHVINPGITPHQAGEKYIALILDYGFYVGMRLARSIKVIQESLQTPTYQELRKLSVFK